MKNYFGSKSPYSSIDSVNGNSMDGSRGLLNRSRYKSPNVDYSSPHDNHETKLV